MQTIYDAKILIVDDNQDLLNLVTTALRSTGYNQLTACTGCAAAQAAFAANRPDLMILDINLPDGGRLYPIPHAAQHGGYPGAFSFCPRC